VGLGFAGRIWFSLKERLGRLLLHPRSRTLLHASLPALPQSRSPPPPPHHADNHTAKPGRPVSNSSISRLITFEVPGLSLAVPGRISFDHFLEGFSTGT